MRSVCQVSILAVALACGTQGHAQRAGEIEVADARLSDDAGPVASDEAEIVVTGERVERSLQETVSSVAVTTSRRIDQENLQTLQDVFNRTANVSETYGSTGFTIRGIANQGVSSAGDAPLSTIYVDGAALPDQIVGSAPTDLWDIAQVEVFRGPQSTLQGLNALAGAIIIRTQDPTMDWDARFRATVAEYDTTSFAAALGGPIVANELAFRIAAEKRDSDGFTFNETRNAPEDGYDSLMLRGRLLWTPSALPGFTARLGYTYFDREAGYDFTYTDINRPDFFDYRIATSNSPNASDVRADIGTLELTYEINDALSLSSVTSYSDVSQSRSYDGDLSAANLSFGGSETTFETISEELRLNIDTSWLSGVLGAYYYHRDQDNRATSLTLVPTPVSTAATLLQQAGIDAATANFVANLYAQALPDIPVQYEGIFPSEVESFALFGDARVRVTDRLTALLGFRYDRETNAIEATQTTAFAGTFPDPAAYGPLAPLIAGLNAGVQSLVDQAAGSAPLSERTFKAFLPKIGVEMAWTPDLATSFVVQRGYRSGGSSSNTARSQVFPYDPEYTWNYELSLRSRWLNGRLTLNANAFYIDWTDQQASVNFGLNLYDYNTVNAGRSHLYGFEIEAAHRVNRFVQWYASIGHVKTKFDEFITDIGTVTDLSGLEFIYAPRLTLAAGVNVQVAEGLTFNLNGSHRSWVYTDVGRPQTQYRVGARTLVNGRVAYDFRNFTIAVFANNLFGEDFYQYINPLDPVAVLGQPRVIGITLEGRF